MPLNHVSKYAQLTDKQFKLIGQVVVEWTNIEFLQKSCLLLFPEFLSRVYTDLISAARLQDGLKDAMSIHRQRYQASVINKDLLKEIEQVNNNIARVRAHRNRIAHFCWTRSNDEEIFGTNFSSGLPGSKKDKKSDSIFKNRELEDLYRESYELVESTEKLIARIPEVGEEQFVKWVKAEQGVPPDRRESSSPPGDHRVTISNCN